MEFSSWIAKFTAYYTSSRMNLSSIAEQHAYFRACLDGYLDNRIRDTIAADTPILGDDSCLALLRTEFLTRYPVFTRRLEYFRAAQPVGQTFTEWAASLRRKGEEASLDQMVLDDYTVMRYITGTSDAKLKEKFIAARNPTVAALNTIATDYEATIASLKAMNSASTSYAAAAGRNRQKSPARKGKPKKGKGKSSTRSSRDRKGSRSRSPPKKSRNPKRDRMMKEGLCFRCNKARHDDMEDCRARDATCDSCGKDGHYASACFAGQFEDKKQRSRSRSPSARSSPAKGRARSHSRAQAQSVVVGCIYDGPNSPTPRLHVGIRSNGTAFEYPALPDTGATRSIIDASLAHTYGIVTSTRRKERITTASGEGMRCLGTVFLDVSFGDKVVKVDALVAVGLQAGFLLSWHDLQRLDVLTQTFPSPPRSRRNPHATVAVIHTSTDTIAGLLKEYSDVFDDSEVTPMNGPPMTVHLRTDDPDYYPSRCLTARLIPKHYQSAAQEAIDLFVKSGVIEKVSGPTDWISPAFFVPKANGKVRLVVDYSNINRFIRRPVHPFPCPRDIIRGILPTSKFFVKLDATQGYFQIPLDDDSKDLTTFLLPSGRYRFTRAPMGMNSSSDEWCARSDDALSAIPDVVKIVDDTLIQADTEEEAIRRLRIALDCCRKANITLAKKKVEIGTSIPFAGYIISSSGVKPDPAKIEALSAFPTPTDLTQLRGFLGLANQLGFFVPDLAHMTAPLRQLLKKEVAYVWLEDHEDAFNTIKKMLTSSMVVHPFDPKLKSELLTDASRLHGLGYALVQKEGSSDRLRLVQCGSRSLLPAESKYATNELEMLAIQWAIVACKYYLLGADFTVVTDHRPLQGTFTKPLADITNARLLRFREKLADYRFNVVWTPGKTHMIADALSRSPVFHPDPADHSDDVTVNHVTTDPSLQFIADEASRDEAYGKVRTALLSCVRAADLPPDHPARPFKQVWDDLSVDGAIIIYDGQRIVIPSGLREQILGLLHRSHAGITRTKKLAREYYYWPGIGNDITKMVDRCEACQLSRPSQAAEPLQPHPEATYPMHSLSMDLFEEAGKHYLLVVDRFSGYPFVFRLRSLKTSAIIDILRDLFLTWGYPDEILTDGGPQFRTEFHTYCEDNWIEYDISSPYHQQSNGQAEAAVKNMKTLMAKCSSYSDFESSLQFWRSTPRSKGNESPSLLFLGRKPRTRLPGLRKKTKVARTILPAYGLQQLHPGDRVRVQNPLTKKWSKLATVQSVRSSGRSYYVKVDDGNILLRNRVFLKLLPSVDTSFARRRELISDSLTTQMKSTTFPATQHAEVQEKEGQTEEEDDIPPSGSPLNPSANSRTYADAAKSGKSAKSARRSTKAATTSPKPIIRTQFVRRSPRLHNNIKKHIHFK